MKPRRYILSIYTIIYRFIKRDELKKRFTTTGIRWPINPPLIKRFTQTPVLDVGPKGSWDSDSVASASIINANGKYYMFYFGKQEKTTRIGLAYSKDGVNWKKHKNNPILDIGKEGDWDSKGLVHPDIVKIGEEYYLFYSGFDGVKRSLGYATSKNLIEWEKFDGNPIIRSGPKRWDICDLWGPDVIKIKGKYHLYYHAYDNVNLERIGLAISDDLVSWHKYNKNPILDVGLPGSYDDVRLTDPTVIKIKGKYYMWYDSYDGKNYRLSLANSEDGVNWKKHNGNPIMDIGPKKSWDSFYVATPEVKMINNELYIWYSGNNGTKWRIGLAKCDVKDIIWH